MTFGNRLRKGSSYSPGVSLHVDFICSSSTCLLTSPASISQDSSLEVAVPKASATRPPGYNLP
jgi:hypothetical protein